MPIAAVIFDLDDTLWPTRPVLERAELEQLAEHVRAAPGVAERENHHARVRLLLGIGRGAEALGLGQRVAAANLVDVLRVGLQIAEVGLVHAEDRAGPILVPPGAPDAFATALLTILRDDDVATVSLLDVALSVSAVRKVCTTP